MVGHSGGSHDGIWVAACATAANGLIREGHDERVIDFMAQVGLQTKSHDDVAVREHLSVALTLCSQASNNIDMDASEEGMKRVLRAASLLRDQYWRFLRRGCSQALSLSGRSWTQLERPSPEQTKERAKSWTHFAKSYRQVSGKRDSQVMRFLVRSYCSFHRCTDQLCIPPGI